MTNERNAEPGGGPDPGNERNEGNKGNGGNGGVADDVRELVAAALTAVGRAGTTSAASLADTVEGAGRSLTRRVVSGALDAPRPVGDRRLLADALAARPATPVLASATGAALVARSLSRFRLLNFLSRRTPMWIMAGLVPALIASVSRGADELGMIASHLVRRTRDAGLEPDPERIRRAAVQVMSGAPIDPDVEPGHGALVVAWFRRAFRTALPFASGIATRDPEGLAAVAAEVDPKQVAAGL
jgi:hypothetical protein